MTTPTDEPVRTEDVRVFIVDDHAMVRAGVRALLGSIEGFTTVGDCGDAREAVGRVAQSRPDIILLDVTMPGLSGIDAIAPFRAAYPRVKIVMLSHHEGGSFVEQSLQHGADGYLSKDSDPDELALALRTVMHGGTYLSPRVTHHLVEGIRRPGAGTPAATPLASLTPREREVFQLLALGLGNKQVARKLDVTLSTAKKHRENLQRKLDCHSTAELTRLAVREGLLDD